jgi:UDP-N-acetylmuramoyl-tripeptide--D-alanyl-D-alanine ligase
MIDFAAPPSPVDRRSGKLTLRQRVTAQLERWRRLYWQRRARHAQRAYCGCFVAITGSCGKTTATLLAQGLLAATGASVAASKGFNDGRYVWRTMGELRQPTDFVIQEVAGGEPGAIALTTDHLRVDVAVVTTIGYDHNATFGVSYTAAPDAIAAEKGKLVAAVPANGLVCLNADDSRVDAMAALTSARVITYGRSAGATLRATNVAARWPERLGFDLEVAGETYPVRTRFVGTLMLPSILAALAVVHGTGRDLRAAIAALESAEPEPDHMSILTGASGRTYVLDTYKAPYWSTQLLADDLVNIGRHDTLFVLGNMSDMRNGRSGNYLKVVRSAATGAGRVILTADAGSAAPRAAAEGFDNVHAAPDLESVARLIAAAPERLVILKSGDTIPLNRVVALVEAAHQLQSEPQLAANSQPA